MSDVRWRVTARDTRWLEWMARWRFTTAPLIEREFTGRGESAPLKAVERRLRGLAELGLLEYERVLADVPRLYWLTGDGVHAAGQHGAVAKPKLAEIRHDLAVMDVAHWLASERVPSHSLVTEREIRREEWATRGEPKPKRYSLPLPHPGSGRAGRAWPDLVSVSPEGKAWGHEVEASVKDHRRLVRLMLGFATSDVYRGAVYYPTSERTRESVQRAADEANETAQARGGRRPIAVTPWPIYETKEKADG